MTQYFEGFRFDITTAAASSGTDLRLVPKAGTLALYRKGATITAGTGGGPGNVAMTISDPGTIVPGDTVQIGNGVVTGTVQAGGYTSTSITVSWPQAVTWASGDRLIVNTVSSRPAAYSDPYMSTSLGTSVSFGATTGRASFYCSSPEIDIIRTVGSDVDVLPDQGGTLRPENHTPLVSGLKADGSTDDGPALANLVTRIAAKGRGVIDLPPGDILINTVVPLANIAGLRFRGAGRGITRIVTSTAASIQFTVSGTSSDISFEDLTLMRSSAGSTALVTIGSSTCVRTAFRRVNFTRGYIAVTDAGTDTIYDDLSFDGADWVTGITFLAATRPSLVKLVARFGNSLGATDAFLNVGSGTTGLRGRDVNVAPSDTSLFSGSALKISGATDPSDIIFTTSRFTGGFTGSPRAAVLISDGRGLRFNSCTFADSLNSIALTNDVVDLAISDCTQVGMRQHGINVSGEFGVLTIQGLISSDVSQQTANTYSHIFLEPATQGLYASIDQVAYGNMINGSATTAKYVVRANANVNFTSLTGVGGDYFTIGTSVFNLDAAINGVAAIAHNEESSDQTKRHDALALPVLSTASTTPSVQRRFHIRMTAATTITNFTNGRDGQLIAVWNASGGNVVFTNNANIATGTGANYTSAAAGDVNLFCYDGTSSIWRRVRTT